MRITNSMMMNTSRSNINTNKARMDIMNTQMATQKKIAKPSDDPIVALRSLRLRRNVSELEQYYDRNIPDAESWLEVTEAAMSNMRDLLKDMYHNYTKGTNGNLSSSDRTAILKSLEALKTEFYGEGNTSYAGRRVFTGYKTNTDLTFKSADTTASYNINETFQVKDIGTKTYISNCVTSDLTNLTTISATDTPQTNQVTHHALTYSGMDGIQSLSYTDAAGNEVTIPVQTTSLNTNPDAAYLIPPSDGVNYIPETGELIFGSDIEAALKSLGSNTVITANYDKTGFAEGEVNPVMYYDCVDLNTGVQYKKETQDIQYQVGYNQKIKVNTEASDLFNLNIFKEVNELTDAVTAVTDAENKLAELKDMMENDRYSDAEKEAIKSMYKATEKELELKKDRMQKLFEKGVGSFQKYEEEVNLQIADSGNRSSRLKLIKERMSQQKQNFEELLTTNEDRELSDIVLDYTAATTAYEAALTAMGKISQLSLLNYV